MGGRALAAPEGSQACSLLCSWVRSSRAPPLLPPMVPSIASREHGCMQGSSSTDSFIGMKRYLHGMDFVRHTQAEKSTRCCPHRVFQISKYSICLWGTLWTQGKQEVGSRKSGQFFFFLTEGTQILFLHRKFMTTGVKQTNLKLPSALALCFLKQPEKSCHLLQAAPSDGSGQLRTSSNPVPRQHETLMTPFHNHCSPKIQNIASLYPWLLLVSGGQVSELEIMSQKKVSISISYSELVSWKGSLFFLFFSPR